MATIASPAIYSGRFRADGCIVEASPELRALHRRCGGGDGDPLALPGLPLLIRRAAGLRMPLSTSVLMAERGGNVTFWARAVPADGAVDVQLFDWTGSEAPLQHTLQQAVRERDFIRASSDWTWTADARLHWTSLSESAVAVFGRPISFLLNQPMGDVLRPIDGSDGNFRVGSEPALWFQGRTAVTAGEGPRRYFRLSATPVHDAGRLTGFKGEAAEISEAEAAASVRPTKPSSRQAPARPAATDILRAPLEQITRSAEAMRTRQFGHLKGVYADYAGDIASAARHLRTLIDDVFDVAAIDSGMVNPAIAKIDLTALAEEARAIVSQRAAAAGSAILWRSAPPSVVVRADRGRLLQILINLMQNAVKFAGEAGPVRLLLEVVDDEARFRVDDQGQGIPPAERERVFAKFERLRPADTEGSGLGLYISRALARAMGGDIAVSESPEGGARFTLVLSRA